MTKLNSTFLLRWSISIILIAHSGIFGPFFTNINNFGNLYLNQIGFDPLGVPLAWSIKISHIVAALCLIFGKYVRWACIVTISIMVAGIALVHFEEGWFVVGAGRNGVEFNFLIIFGLLTIMFPNGFSIPFKKTTA